MTIGISKKDLLELQASIFARDTGREDELRLLTIIIDQCKELNPWLPIDENTPKDRALLVWSDSDGHEVAYWSTSVWVERGGSWIVKENRSDTRILHPTYYQEITGRPKGIAMANKKLTGGSSDYYKVTITTPTSPDTKPYIAECNDIIEALNLSFAESNIVKAIWRIAKNRTGEGKPGTNNLYDAEKVEFFADRLLIIEQNKIKDNNDNR